MNPIRLLRGQTGVTQQTLATRAGTSQSTIAFYEKGVKSPTLATMQRLAASLGLELIITFTPKLTREDHRSLAYHQAVAKLVKQDPLLTINRAKRTLQKMSQHHLGAKALFDRWTLWLELPTDQLIAEMLDPGIVARDMRQVSPFAGLLPPKERAKILEKFRKEFNR